MTIFLKEGMFLNGFVACQKELAERKKKKMFGFQKEKIIKDIRQTIKASSFDFS